MLVLTFYTVYDITAIMETLEHKHTIQSNESLHATEYEVSYSDAIESAMALVEETATKASQTYGNKLHHLPPIVETYKSANVLAHLTANTEKDHPTTSSELAALYGASPLGVYSSLFLDIMKNNRQYNQENFRLFRNNATEFNHSLSDFIYRHPDIHTNEFTDSMIDTLENTVPLMQGQNQLNMQQDAMDRRLKSLIKGAAYESMANQVLDSIGLEYRSASVDEDIHGADLFLQMNKNTEIKVDIKSSLDQIQNNNGNYQETFRIDTHKSGDRKIIWWPMIDQRIVNRNFQYDPSKLPNNYESLVSDQLERAITQYRSAPNFTR